VRIGLPRELSVSRGLRYEFTLDDKTPVEVYRGDDGVGGMRDRWRLLLYLE
jgi:hypothetical protein